MGKVEKIEIGDRFTRLTTVEFVGERKWKCKCDCGNEVVVYGYNLRRGHNKSCGCLRYVKKNNIYIKPYIYKHLKEFGNTVLSKKVYDKLGEEEVLKQLKEKGFDCYVDIKIHKDMFKDEKSNKYEDWRTIILRVKE